MDREQKIAEILRLVEELIDNADETEEICDVIFIVQDMDNDMLYKHNIETIEEFNEIVDIVLEDALKENTEILRTWNNNSLN